MELIGAGKGFEFYVEEHIWLFISHCLSNNTKKHFVN